MSNNSLLDYAKRCVKALGKLRVEDHHINEYKRLRKSWAVLEKKISSAPYKEPYVEISLSEGKVIIIP